MTINTIPFEQFPVLTTDRLTFREIRIADAQKIFEMRSNGRVNQFIGRKNMESLDDALKLTERIQQAYEKKEAIAWAGILRNGNEIIGACGLREFDFPNLRAEIGGELSVEYWGKNIALEAVSTIVDFGLNTMNLHSIEAKVSPENRGAVFLLEYIGFKKEAHFTDRIFFNGKFSDMAVYTLIRGNEKIHSI